MKVERGSGAGLGGLVRALNLKQREQSGGKVQGHIALGQDGEKRLDLRQSICEQVTDQEQGMRDQGTLVLCIKQQCGCLCRIFRQRRQTEEQFALCVCACVYWG